MKNWLEGVVLVDEIETHSPFILSSLDDVVIYDVENKTLVERCGVWNII